MGKKKPKAIDLNNKLYFYKSCNSQSRCQSKDLNGKDKASE